MKITVNAILVALSASVLGLASSQVAHSASDMDGPRISRGIDDEHAHYLRGELADSAQYIRDEINYAKVVRHEFESLFARVEALAGNYRCGVKRKPKAARCERNDCVRIAPCIAPTLPGSTWGCEIPTAWSTDGKCDGCMCYLKKGEPQRLLKDRERYRNARKNQPEGGATSNVPTLQNARTSHSKKAGGTSAKKAQGAPPKQARAPARERS